MNGLKITAITEGKKHTKGKDGESSDALMITNGSFIYAFQP